MSKDNLTAVLYGVQDLRLEQRPIPEISDNEVLLEMDCVGICGSDMHYLVHGRIGDFVVNKPMVIGREAAGVVVKCGKSVKNLVVGDRVAIVPGVPCRFCKTGKYNLCPDMVFCATPPYDGNLTKYYRHAADFCFKLPPHVTMEEGALLEPLSVGVHACRRADVGLGSEVLILGAGPIGLVTLLVAQSMGASNIVITDLFENRLNVAKSLGAMHTVLISKDKTIDCCGAESTTRLAILNTRSGRGVVIVGMGGNESKLSLINASAREVDIRGVFRYCNDYPTALALVASGKVDAKCLVTHHFDIIETTKAFETSRYGQGGAIKVMIHCQPRNNLTNLIMAKQLQNKLENREFESKLIIEIKNHFCLYAKNTEEYCNRNKRENAWVDIALIIGRRVEDCQKKWNSLRDHFRALYKNECNAPSGSGATSKVKWVHYETLKFLIPYIAVPADDCGNYIDESYEDLIEVCFEEDSYQTQNLQNIENTADRKRKAEQRTAKPKKKKNNEDDDLDRVLKAIDNVASPSSTINKKPIQMFFDGIAIQVEHFSAIKKIELQQKVLRLLATDFADQF